jgi:hypothetical protein
MDLATGHRDDAFKLIHLLESTLSLLVLLWTQLPLTMLLLKLSLLVSNLLS